MLLSRRDFLGKGASAGAAAVAVSTLDPFSLFGAEAAAAAAAGPSARTLVIVTLHGGNDGLNTVVPFTDSRYIAGRGALALKADEVLALADGLGLNKSCPGLKARWDAGSLAIVRGVGYQDPSFSHFTSMDIWQTGDAKVSTLSGWVGRWLEATGRTSMRAVNIGSSLPRAFQGERVSGMTVPGSSFRLPGSRDLVAAFGMLGAPSAEDDPLSARVAQTGADLVEASHTVTDALTRTAATPNLPNSLATQLDTVARLIKAGMPTRVYMVHLGGFDTHTDEKANQARLLGQLDAAVSSFFASLAGAPNGDGVVLMAHSEFGRRVAANASNGTDHGSAGVAFVTGPGVRGGFHGDQPDLGSLVNGNLKVTTDFRSLYGGLLTGVLEVDPSVALGPGAPAPLSLVA